MSDRLRLAALIRGLEIQHQEELLDATPEFIEGLGRLMTKIMTDVIVERDALRKQAAQNTRLRAALAHQRYRSHEFTWACDGCALANEFDTDTQGAP